MVAEPTDTTALATRYRDWVAAAVETHGEHGWSFAIGGNFEAFGVIQRNMLVHYGLRRADSVIEIGCGSGRLAAPLGGYLDGPYVGLDVVPALLEQARTATNRPDWRFDAAQDFRLPAADGSIDMVCCFSVFTHLLHEQTYLYLEEAARVLRPGGRIVFSFLEFAMDFQWNVFEATVAQQRHGTGHPLNMFIERSAIAAWARHLGLDITDLRNGDAPFVPLAEPVTLDTGVVMVGQGNLGQSICVLAKPG